MKCKKMEELIINTQAVDLEKRKKIALEKHIQSCPNCSNFLKGLLSIREKVTTSTVIEPSDSLIETTIQRCHSELSVHNQFVSKYSFSSTKIPTPSFIWMIVFAIVTVSFIWFFPILKDLISKNIISDQTIWVVVVIVQNIIMLLSAPIILTKIRNRKKSLNRMVFI